MSASAFFGIGRLCFLGVFTTSRTLSASVLCSSSRPRILVQCFRSFASKTLESEPEAPVALSHLKDSSGFCLHTAKDVAAPVNFDSPETSHSVINLLKDEGFTDAQISKVIRIRQIRVTGNPKTSILPKLEFFHSVGCSNADIATIFSRNPVFLMRSLDKFIAPCYDIIKSVVGIDSKVIRSFKRNMSHSHLDLTLLASNFGLLREAGVHKPSLSILLVNYPSILFQRSSKFSQVLAEVEQMGFDPSKSYFVTAMWVLSSRTKSTLESKLDMFLRLGLSREDAWTVFKKQPMCLVISVKKIKKVMDFFLNETPWQSQEIARCPRVFLHSLERRTIPRSSVARVLLSKGLVNEIRLSTLLSYSEKLFVEKYITRFQGNVPQLLDLYKGKVSLADI